MLRMRRFFSLEVARRLPPELIWMDASLPAPGY